MRAPIALGDKLAKSRWLERVERDWSLSEVYGGVELNPLPSRWRLVQVSGHGVSVVS